MTGPVDHPDQMLVLVTDGPWRDEAPQCAAWT